MKLPKLNPYALLMGILQGVLGNGIYQAISSAMPLLIGTVIATRLRAPNGVGWFWIGAGTGLSLALALWWVWFHFHTRGRYKRTKRLLTKIFISDSSLNRIIVNKAFTLTRPDMELKINALLGLMCDVLVYRMPAETKGATLLLLADTGENLHFELFAQVRHEEMSLTTEVRDLLHVEGSLAGQALRENRCIVLRDCRKRPSHKQWADTHNPPRYVGRAATPVQTIPHEPSSNIGVLCFDLSTPLTLSLEDRMLMEAIADKIASLWILYQPNHKPSP